MAARDDSRIDDDAPAKASLFYDPRFRSIVAQVVLLLLVVWGGYEIVRNTSANLEKQQIASGFGFLDRTAGFGIIQTLVDYTEESSYGRTFIVGLLNTILISALGILLATALGFVVGVARLSSNWVISRIALAYVEIMRNIPLLLHIFIWYFAVLRSLPQPRDEPITLIPGFAFLNVKGVFMPQLVSEPGFWMTATALGVALVLSMLVANWSRKRQEATGQQFPVGLTALGLIIALPAITFLATGRPASLEYPVFVETGPVLRRGFTQDVGINVIPEFISLLLALSTYTAAYIAEIVRAGIQAVNHGQTEASFSLGLRRGPTLRLVVIPQAMRVIIPPMTNQYLNLTKNSSLATAIAYPDLVSVFAGTTLNQTGQAVEIILMTMGVYLTLSISISIVMNWYNARIALVER
ncbi:MAG: ABC transporter permease subunit [Rhizobiales bacterium]|nr:ABC transporter permease subunit [Hyphomicrobiales bacterium]